jgi:hydroxymethylpyrimidine/phosphomethylpyrimidine kinase
MPVPVALSIAGSDPSGGAGIQADLKTFQNFGVYGEAVITLITVQNSLGVERVHVLNPDLIVAQIRLVISDIRPQAAKTGALGNRAVAEALGRMASEFDFPLVVDPVGAATRGDALGDLSSIGPLIARAFLITPNLDEAEAICGFPVMDLASMRRAADSILALGAANVLVKGGHLGGNAVDLLCTSAGDSHEFTAARIATRHTHGTGCGFSAAITAELAKGTELVDAVRSAKRFITEAIRTNPGLGSGSGPLNFFAR